MASKKQEESHKRKREHHTMPHKQQQEEEEQTTSASSTSTEDGKKGGNDLEGRDFYEVLGISKIATFKEITIAYRKLAAKIHPDKNPDDPYATAKFQTLGLIHKTLSDEEKRKIYDQTGETSDDAVSTSDVDWTAYFNLIFKRLSPKDVKDFAKTYRGSEEEKNDVCEAYTKHKGDIEKVIDVVMLSRDVDIGRFATLCHEGIQEGTLKSYTAFKKYQKHVGKNTKIQPDSEDETNDIPLALTQQFAERKKQFDDLTARLEAKYGGGNELDDEEEGGGSARKKKKVATRVKKSTKKVSLTKGKKKVKVVVESEEEEGEDVEA